MHTASMNVTIQSVACSVKRVEKMSTQSLSYVPNFIKSFLDSVLTRRARKMAFSLADACGKLQIIVLSIQGNTDTELMDPSLERRDSIDEMKTTILAQMTGLRQAYLDVDPVGDVMPKFHKEITSVVSLCREFYEIATELQWAIAEHDASNSAQRPGYVATSADEVSALLERISAGA